MSSWQRFTIAAVPAVLYAAVLTARLTGVDPFAPPQIAWFVINTAFALVGILASLALTREERLIAIGLSALIGGLGLTGLRVEGCVLVGVTAFAIVTAWMWITNPRTIEALSRPASPTATAVRYAALTGLLIFQATAWSPLVRWLSPPAIMILPSLFVVPAVACALAPGHRVLFAALANACPIIPFMFEADPTNSHPWNEPESWLFVGIWFGLAIGASLVFSGPFLLHARKRASALRGAQ